MSPVASAFALLPKDYAWTALVASSTFYLHLYQILKVSSLRKASGIKYPQLYAEVTEVEKSPVAKQFNCAQRAHANTLEILPQMLFGLLFNGLAYPKLSAAFGASWVVGRFLYTYGYVTGRPEARYSYGGMLHLIGWAGTWFLSSFVAGRGVYDLLI